MNVRTGFFALAGVALGGLLATGADARRRPVEPVPVPSQIEQGVDMIFVDPELRPNIPIQIMPAAGDNSPFRVEPLDEFVPLNPLFKQLRLAYEVYHRRWGSLPGIILPPGPPLSKGSNGPRVVMLRQRLGLSAGDQFDTALDAKVRDFQKVHGLSVDGIAAGKTFGALNLFPRHYELRLIANLERAKRLPAPGRFRRYIVIDAASSELTMVENGKAVGKMKVGVGTPESPTPMMAAMIRFISVNPYWNVPADLAQTLIAPKVLAQGISYLTERHYLLLSDWTEDAVQVDPARVDWQRVAQRRQSVRLRRDPSPGNSMGTMKFMLPNDYGIYLHDYPDKSLFAKDARWVSNGCVRLEDANRLAKWLTGKVPAIGGQPEKRVDLHQPVPVYMTYLTAVPTATGVQFRPDTYGRDRKVLFNYYHAQVPIGAF